MAIDSIARQTAEEALTLVNNALEPVTGTIAQSLAAAQTAATNSEAAASTAIEQATTATGAALAATGAEVIATNAATTATTGGQIATTQANIAVAALGSRGYLGTPVSSGGTLPNQILSISGGGGTGGTPGTYIGGVSGAGFPGFQWQLVVSSAGVSTPEIVTHGLSTSSAVPTLVMPTVLGLTGATTPTVTVGAIPPGTVFTAPDGAYANVLGWGNNNGVLASAPFGQPQISVPTAAYFAVFGFDASSVRYLFGKPALAALLDNNHRLLWAVTADGYHYAKYTIKIGAAANGLGWAQDANGFWNISLGTTQGQLPLGSNGDLIDTSVTRYINKKAILLGAMDANRRPVGPQTTADGRTVIPRFDTDHVVAVSGSYVFTEKVVNGLTQIFRTSTATGSSGISTQVTFVGNNCNPVVTPDGTKLLYATDRLGAWTYYWQPVGGLGLPGQVDHPVLPIGTAEACFGDSLTQGQEGYINVGYYPTVLATLRGRPVANYGIGGQVSTQIAMRQGGVATSFTVAGNQITTGANSISAINGVTIAPLTTSQSPDYRFLSTPASNGTFTATGYLCGVHGTVTRTSAGNSVADTYTFTPDAGYSGTTACPAGSAFYVDTLGSDDEITHIWSGRNNYQYGSVVLSDIAAMVAFLKPLGRRYTVIGIINSAAEPSGSTGFATIAGINATLSSTYGSSYVDAQAALAAAGNTSDPMDAADIANGRTPCSLRAQYSYTLSGAVGSTDTSLTLTGTNNSPAPAVGFVLKIDSEYILVTAVSGYTVTACTRGYAGSAAAHASGAYVLGTEQLHLNLQGYTAIANAVYARETANNW